MQGRGLKHGNEGLPILQGKSPLVQGRGLKHYIPLVYLLAVAVAPRAGAWIET